MVRNANIEGIFLEAEDFKNCNLMVFHKRGVSSNSYLISDVLKGGYFLWRFTPIVGKLKVLGEIRRIHLKEDSWVPNLTYNSPSLSYIDNKKDYTSEKEIQLLINGDFTNWMKFLTKKENDINFFSFNLSLPSGYYIE